VLIDLEAGKTRWQRRGSTHLISALAFSSDSRMLASAAAWAESSIRLWNVDDGVELGRLIGHRAWVSDLKFIPGENKLISSSADRSIRIWDVTQPELPTTLLTLRGHEQEVWRLALSDDDRTLVSGDKDGAILVWNLGRVRIRDPRRILPRPAESWSFASDGNSVFTVDEAGRVERWAAPDYGESQVLLELGPEAVVSLPYDKARFSSDGRLLAVYLTLGKVVVWDIDKSTILCELPTGKVDARISLFTDQAEKLLVSYRGQPTVHLWNLRTGKEEPLPNLRNFVYGSWDISADEQWVLGVRRDGVGDLKNQRTDQVRQLKLDGSRINDGAFSPDNSLFAISSNVGYVKLWETSSFTEVGQLKGFLLGVHSVTFSPDGTRLATGSGGFEAIKLWDVRSRRELLNLEGQGSLFNRIQFSSCGDSLGSGSARGPVHIWRAPSWEEIEAAEPEAGRPAGSKNDDD
jgi:WD40 repeat protein